MSHRSYSALIFSLLMLLSCQRIQKEKGGVCYSFDVRQCGTDLFDKEVSATGSKSQRESDMTSWLQGQGLSVVSTSLTENYHELVCEACDVCPQGDRYYIECSDSLDESMKEKLRLLNLEKIPCN